MSMNQLRSKGRAKGSERVNKGKKTNQNLLNVKIVLPASLPREEMRMVISEVRTLCTRYTISTPKDGKILVDTWCTAKQAHRMQNFARGVLQAHQFDEGYDMAEVRRELERRSEGQPDDSFVLPRDTNRLSIQNAAAGIQAAILDWPAFRDEGEVEKLGERMCDLAPDLWPGVTNDMQLYREIAIPAHTTGYRYGVQLLSSMKMSDQREFAERVLDAQVSKYDGPRSLQSLAQMLTEQMKEQGVSSIYDLHVP